MLQDNVLLAEEVVFKPREHAGTDVSAKPYGKSFKGHVLRTSCTLALIHFGCSGRKQPHRQRSTASGVCPQCRTARGGL